MALTNLVANTHPIGGVISAMLSLSQFQTLNGVGWIIADGSNVAGSAYATITGNTTVPDLRGQFLRGKNNGRSDGSQDLSGDQALGFTEGDTLQGHGHSMPTSALLGSQTTSGLNNGVGVGGGYSKVGEVGDSTPSASIAGALISDGTNGTPRFGTETRPRSVVVNHFIRIN